MSEGEHPLQDWFDIAVAALREEDLFLRNCLQPYSTGTYAKWSAGVSCLYETGIVYIILRALWRASYPRALTWEYPYPEWNEAKLDLGIFDESPAESIIGRHPAHVFEVKRKWIGSSAKEYQGIWWDLLRLLWFAEARHRYVLLLDFSQDGSQLERDVDDLINMRFGRSREQYTLERLVASLITQETQYRPYYLEHFGGVHEALWAGFDTLLAGYDAPGCARISLLEVKLRDARS